MELVQIINDIPLESPVKILVYKDGAVVVDFMTKVKDRLEDEEFGPGISVAAIYLQGKQVNFKNFSVVIKYRGVDNRDYHFSIQNVIYDYEHGLIKFYDRRKAKVTNKRNAYRFECKYRIVLRNTKTDEEYIGNCSDISYAGVGCFVQDPEKKLEVGTPVYVDIYSEEASVRLLTGKIVRIKDGHTTTEVFLGVQVKKETPEYSAMIQSLQLKMLRTKQAKGQ